MPLYCYIIYEGEYECSSATVTDPIVESYTEFVVTPEMAEANEGMTAGTYSFRSGVDECVVDENYECTITSHPIYDANKAVLLSAFGSTNCTDNTTNFRCVATDLSADIAPVGSNYVFKGSDHCTSTGCGTLT